MAKVLRDLPDSLPNLVEATYRSASAASKIVFTPTEVSVVHTKSGLPFQLRFVSSLSRKPLPKNDAAKGTKSNSFEDPDPQMVIANVPGSQPTHFLMLNKFPIIAGHFMLVTKVNKAQTQKLEHDDLEAAYACLQEWSGRTAGGSERRLFAFFNSGEHSGASQQHRHLQFLPVEAMTDGLDGQTWELLMDKLTQSTHRSSQPVVPFAYYWSTIPSNPSSTQLLNIYHRLYDAAFTAMHTYFKSHPENVQMHETTSGSSTFSYNIGMTTAAMVICPRRSESMRLQNLDGTEAGAAALNGTLLAGSLLVKKREEWECVRNRVHVLDEILEAVGIPADLSIGPKI